MAAFPEWLADMVTVNPWTEETFDALYKVFEQDFKHTQPIYEGKRVWYFPELIDGKEAIFWHLTHREDKVTSRRLPDLRRSERLPWIRKMIDNHKKPEILAWDHKEGNGTIKTYVWLKSDDFVVIMKKYPDESRRLITSFYIDHSHTRRKLSKKYTKRVV